MRTIVAAFAVAVVSGAALGAANDPLEWAYPPTPVAAPASTDPALIARPGSAKKYTRAGIADAFNPPDWYPNEHAPMPDVVAHGRPPDVRACALCHLPNGAGHPESANLSGLNAAYIARQMTDFKSGGRTSIRGAAMVVIAKAMTDAEINAAAEYFAGLKPVPWTKIVETATVAKSFVGAGAMRFPAPNGGTEPIGRRVIELPVDDEGAEERDTHTGFVANVPPGSIKRGEALAMTGGGKTTPCAICHGPELQGLGDVPKIAGHSAIYIVRQLHDIQIGDRNGPGAALMKPIVAKLTPDDMIALAAYVASVQP